MKSLRILDLFAGIGGFSHAFENVSSEHFKTHAFCEIDKHAQMVLRKHWPMTPIFEDVKTIPVQMFKHRIEIITGGFPCTDISVAGLKKGLIDEDGKVTRSGLCLVTDLQPSSKILAKSGTLVAGRLFQHPPLVPHIFEKGFGLLPTPTARDWKDQMSAAAAAAAQLEKRNSPTMGLLASAGRLWLPTPTTFDSGQPLPPRKKNASGGQRPPLNSVVGGKLCPILVEWMMAYPKNWTKVEHNESNNSETLSYLLS